MRKKKDWAITKLPSSWMNSSKNLRPYVPKKTPQLCSRMLRRSAEQLRLENIDRQTSPQIPGPAALPAPQSTVQHHAHLSLLATPWGLWASKHADYLPVPWCAIERAALKLMPLVSSCWPTTSGQPWRFSQGQHAGSCLSLAKMQSQWWWLCWKIAFGSWEVALSNAVILCSLYLL